MTGKKSIINFSAEKLTVTVSEAKILTLPRSTSNTKNYLGHAKLAISRFVATKFGKNMHIFEHIPPVFSKNLYIDPPNVFGKLWQ